MASSGRLSVLEQKSPGPPTRKDYAKQLDKFLEFCTENGLVTDSVNELDLALTDYADVLYLEGEQVDAGCKLLAAVVYQFPNLGRHGDQRLPRFQRALRAWKRFAPTPSRDPIPWLIVCGIIGCMVRRGSTSHAAMVLRLFGRRSSPQMARRAWPRPTRSQWWMDIGCWPALLLGGDLEKRWS